MNRKGFTLIELLATLVVLGLILGITVISVSGIFKNARDKSEDVFVATVKDAMEMYLNSKLDLNDDISDDDWSMCTNKITKKHGNISVYKASVTFDDVINSEFNPITEKDLVNPANKEVNCNKDFSITIYRDNDFIYYYSINKNSLGCLKNDEGLITNLPVLDSGEYYICH